ncbi:class I SAM-dependent methyltransferase [Smaragdicoccus niigatensis]|uniref:class I SAM-dependent methyltransferase n=1 Tax=Smaragdicoccus niigatensis TaxID=359359 RepID=UPI00037F220D|nr:class I SAM-dependent methyltransferase [Smaragdicoccus niigatensis]
MSFGEWAFAHVYDALMSGSEKKGLADMRRDLLGGAKGEVLEIGAGTGLNLPFYGDEISGLTLAEPSKSMIGQLNRKVEQDRPGTMVLRAPAEDLPFEDNSFDTVVSTLVLCSVDDQPRALRELRRVLRPGGELLLLEHVRSSKPNIVTWQNRLNGVNQFVLQGCNLNRPTLDQALQAGFRRGAMTSGEFPESPPFIRELIIGTLVA